MPFPIAAGFTATMSAFLAVLSDNDTTVVIAIIGMVSSLVTAYLGYKSNSRAKSNKEELKEVKSLVSKPRNISTDGELSGDTVDAP